MKFGEIKRPAQTGEQESRVWGSELVMPHSRLGSMTTLSRVDDSTFHGLCLRSRSHDERKPVKTSQLPLTPTHKCFRHMSLFLQTWAALELGNRGVSPGAENTKADMHTHTHIVHIYTQTHTHKDMYIQSHKHIHSQSHTLIHTYSYTCLHTCTCMQICTCILKYSTQVDGHTLTHTLANTNSHTHLHKHIHADIHESKFRQKERSVGLQRGQGRWPGQENVYFL